MVLALGMVAYNQAVIRATVASGVEVDVDTLMSSDPIFVGLVVYFVGQW